MFAIEMSAMGNGGKHAEAMRQTYQHGRVLCPRKIIHRELRLRGRERCAGLEAMG